MVIKLFRMQGGKLWMILSQGADEFQTKVIKGSWCIDPTLADCMTRQAHDSQDAHDLVISCTSPRSLPLGISSDWIPAGLIIRKE